MEIRRRNLHIETKKIKQKDKQRQGDYLHENSEKLDTPLPNRKMSTPGRNNRLLQDRSKVYNLYGSIDKNSIKNASTSKIKNSKQMKLPLILKLHSMDSTESHLIKQTRNPEQGKQFVKQGKIIYYQHRLLEYFKSSDMNYHSNLHRKHFVESIEAIRIGRYIKTPPPFKTLELPKKNHHVKTIYLDLDETLIHCEQKPSKYSVQTKFPCLERYNNGWNKNSSPLLRFLEKNYLKQPKL